MPLNIRSDEVNTLAAVKLALENELRRVTAAVPLRDRVKALQARIAAHPAVAAEDP